MKYIHSIQILREDDFEETESTTPEEARKLEKLDGQNSMNGQSTDKLCITIESLNGSE